MQISCETTDSGLLLGIENKKYDLQFPKEVTIYADSKNQHCVVIEEN